MQQIRDYLSGKEKKDTPSEEHDVKETVTAKESPQFGKILCLVDRALTNEGSGFGTIYLVPKYAFPKKMLKLVVDDKKRFFALSHKPFSKDQADVKKFYEKCIKDSKFEVNIDSNASGFDCVIKIYTY